MASSSARSRSKSWSVQKETQKACIALFDEVAALPLDYLRRGFAELASKLMPPPGAHVDVVSGVCYRADDCAAVASPAFQPDRKQGPQRHHGTHPYDFVGDPVLARHCDGDDAPYKRWMDCCCAKYVFSGAGALPADYCPPNDLSKPGGFDYANNCRKPEVDRDCNPTFIERPNNFNADAGCSAQQNCCIHAVISERDMPDACNNVDLSCFKSDL